MRVLGNILCSWLLVTHCVSPVMAAEASVSESAAATSGWRPVVDRVIEGGASEQEVTVPAVVDASGWRAAGASLPVATVNWRSLVDEAAQVARVWTKRLEVGARVVKGNTDQDFVRVAGVILREREKSLHRIDWGGRFGQVNGVRNTNRWFLDSNIDREEPAGWLYYITTKHEYNEFQGVDYRGVGSVGVGYKFVEEENRKILVRLGPAVTLEYYSESEGQRVTEELFAEFEIDWPLFERTRLETKTTMRPSVVALDVFRFRSDTAVLVPLDDEERWSLKLGYLLDYNSSLSSVKGRVPMDLTTNVSIVYLRP